jgi:PAS domain S-box-containing protein
MLALITMFILFVATWSALFLSKQIVIPIDRLVRATAQVSLGHLDYRVETGAIDELGLLVRSFNQMAEQLEHSRAELDARRRFTEAILEAIPTGVISLSAQGEILRVNPSLGRIFPPERAAPARWLEDLFTGEDLAHIRRLIRRSERTGLATGALELQLDGQVKHLAVTVSALDPEGGSRGCVLVLEDTSSLLRAQKSLAWQEVAQRVAHEIKNPLTPIALSAERINRLLARYGPHPEVRDRLEMDRLVERCTATITREIETLKTLVDEFSQFARFPTARPEPGDLNDIVESALETCVGRLVSLRIEKRLAPSLPLVSIDAELFRRAVVNLLDNALEAMIAGPERVLSVTTTLGAAGDTVELRVGDTGHGIAAEDREKLFLPYFSTRRRGTGLGLAIVSRIVAEHQGSIRVEDNHPCGARFVVEIPAVETRVPAEARA